MQRLGEFLQPSLRALNACSDCNSARARREQRAASGTRVQCHFRTRQARTQKSRRPPRIPRPATLWKLERPLEHLDWGEEPGSKHGGPGVLQARPHELPELQAQRGQHPAAGGVGKGAPRRLLSHAPPNTPRATAFPHKLRPHLAPVTADRPRAAPQQRHAPGGEPRGGERRGPPSAAAPCRQQPCMRRAARMHERKAPELMRSRMSALRAGFKPQRRLDDDACGRRPR